MTRREREAHLWLPRLEKIILSFIVIIDTMYSTDLPGRRRVYQLYAASVVLAQSTRHKAQRGGEGMAPEMRKSQQTTAHNRRQQLMGGCKWPRHFATQHRPHQSRVYPGKPHDGQDLPPVSFWKSLRASFALIHVRTRHKTQTYRSETQTALAYYTCSRRSGNLQREQCTCVPRLMCRTSPRKRTLLREPIIVVVAGRRRSVVGESSDPT
jgi:hypothetical protein